MGAAMSSGVHPYGPRTKAMQESPPPYSGPVAKIWKGVTEGFGAPWAAGAKPKRP